MKKLKLLIIILFLPIFISAQQIGNLRITMGCSESKDSIKTKLFPFAEKWRKEYNNIGKDQLSPFFSKTSQDIPLVLNDYLIDGNNDLIAVFQNSKGAEESVDSLLMFSINPLCDLAILSVVHIGKASRQNKEKQILIAWRKVNDSWLLETHSKALKN
jgi:hypothetical protein